MLESRILLYHSLGPPGPPPLAGVTATDTGMMALTFGGSSPNYTVEIWTFNGTAWVRGNPPATAPTIANVMLPGGTPGSQTGIGAAWSAYAPKPTDPIVIATYAGSAYIKVGSGSADQDWTLLGSSTPFATPADIRTGTMQRAAIDPKGLRDNTLTKPTSNGVAGPVDKDFLVRLNDAGQNDAGFLPITGGFKFLGGADLALAASVPASPKSGDYMMHIGAARATVSAGFTGIPPGTKADPGDIVLFDGTNWHFIESNVDLSPFVTKAGVTTMDPTARFNFAPSVGATILDGGTNRGKLANVLIDGGTF